MFDFSHERLQVDLSLVEELLDNVSLKVFGVAHLGFIILDDVLGDLRQVVGHLLQVVDDPCAPQAALLMMNFRNYSMMYKDVRTVGFGGSRTPLFFFSLPNSTLTRLQ